MVAYLRKPGVLMTAYATLFVLPGPWLGLHGPSGYVVHPHTTRNLPQIVLAAFLAWRVTRGGRISLVLIMIFSAAGCALAIGAIVGGIAGLLPGGVPEVPYLLLAALPLGCYGIQILLVFKGLSRRPPESQRCRHADPSRLPTAGPVRRARAARTC